MNKRQERSNHAHSQPSKAPRQHSQHPKPTSVKLVSLSKSSKQQKQDNSQARRNESGSQRSRKGGNPLPVPKLGKQRCNYPPLVSQHLELDSVKVTAINESSVSLSRDNSKGRKAIRQSRESQLAFVKAEIPKTPSSNRIKASKMQTTLSKDAGVLPKFTQSSGINTRTESCSKIVKAAEKEPEELFVKMAPIIDKDQSPVLIGEFSVLQQSEPCGNLQNSFVNKLPAQGAIQEMGQQKASSRNIEENRQEICSEDDDVCILDDLSEDKSSSQAFESRPKEDIDMDRQDLYSRNKTSDLVYDFLISDQNANHSHVSQQMARQDLATRQFLSFNSHPMNQFTDLFAHNQGFHSNLKHFPSNIHASFPFQTSSNHQEGFITPQKPSILGREKSDMQSTAVSRDLSNKKASGEHLLSLQRQLQLQSEEDLEMRNLVLKNSLSGVESREINPLQLDQHQNRSKTARSEHKQMGQQIKGAILNKRYTKAKAKKSKRQFAQQPEQQAHPEIEEDEMQTPNTEMNYLTYEIGTLNNMSSFMQQIELSRNQSLSKANRIQIVIPTSKQVPKTHQVNTFAKAHPQDIPETQMSQFQVPSQQLDFRRTEEFRPHIHRDTSVLNQNAHQSRQASSSVISEPLKKYKCNCSKNGCSKRYCDCLKRFEACSPDVCSCTGCTNTTQNLKLRENSLQKLSKVVPNEGGCNCKNSKCLQGYCECKQNDRGCGDKCKCLDCQNPFNISSIGKIESDPERFEMTIQDVEMKVEA